MNDVRVAVIGCGAVSEFGHLLVAPKISGARVTVLVDQNLPRAQKLGAAHGISACVATFEDSLDLFDAAIVALPHALHSPVCSALLARGKHVLVEKPMANTLEECAQMIAAAQAGKAVLGVGLMRRQLEAHKMAADIVACGMLGRITSFDIREGYIYSWPVASNFFFRRELAGGGVLLDTGAHTVDCAISWLGKMSVLQYEDDAVGGVEANCLAKLMTADGVPGVMELSRTRTLRNTALIRGEKATLEVSLTSNSLYVRLKNGTNSFGGVVRAGDKTEIVQEHLQTLQAQFQNWIDAIAGRTQCAVSGETAMLSIEVIEQCYKIKTPLIHPWEGANT